MTPIEVGQWEGYLEFVTQNRRLQWLLDALHLVLMIIVRLGA